MVRSLKILFVRHINFKGQVQEPGRHGDAQEASLVEIMNSQIVRATQ